MPPCTAAVIPIQNSEFAISYQKGWPKKDGGASVSENQYIQWEKLSQRDMV